MHPGGLAEVISSALSIPTIGIGAGVHCDGQVLVSHDLLGMFEKFRPKFVKQYANLAPLMKEAVQQFNEEVRSRPLPGRRARLRRQLRLPPAPEKIVHSLHEEFAGLP